jgi:hypothetical protein
MPRPLNPLSFDSIEKLRSLYERHCELLDIPKYKIDRAEYNGVLLGIDLVLELNSSIKQFEQDILELEGKSKDDKVVIRRAKSKRANLYE